MKTMDGRGGSPLPADHPTPMDNSLANIHQ